MAEQVSITIRMFAGAAELAGARTVEVKLFEGARVCDARSALVAMLPQLGPLCQVSLWATETEVLTDNSRLDPDSELAMIPPVSGG